MRVFTIGYGTDKPGAAGVRLRAVRRLRRRGGGFGGDGFGGGGSGEQATRSRPTTARCMQISRTTGGSFYRAQDANQLSSALDHLPAAFTIVRKHIDIAAWFAGVGGLLIAAAVALSLWWNRTRRAPARIAGH